MNRGIQITGDLVDGDTFIASEAAVYRFINGRWHLVRSSRDEALSAQDCANVVSGRMRVGGSAS